MIYTEEQGKQILSDGICRRLNPGMQLRHKRTKEIYTLDHFRIELSQDKRKKTVAYVLKTDDGKFMVVINGRSELAFRFEMPEDYRDPQLWLGDGI